MAGAAGAVTRGVDSTADASDALESGKQLAKQYGCIVGISGRMDLVRLLYVASCCMYLQRAANKAATSVASQA